MSEPTYGQEQGALTQAAGYVTEAKADLDREVVQLEGHMETLRKQWGGRGAEEFQRLQQAWRDRLKVINKALDDFSDSLGQTEKLNFTNDDENVASYKSIDVDRLAGR